MELIILKLGLYVRKFMLKDLCLELIFSLLKYSYTWSAEGTLNLQKQIILIV